MKIFIFMGDCNIRDFTILTDNQSCIDMSSNLVGARQRSRHFRLRLHDIRQMIADKDMVYKYINTSLQLGDFYTKLLNTNDFVRLRNLIMGLEQLSEQQRTLYKSYSIIEALNKEVGVHCNNIEDLKCIKFHLVDDERIVVDDVRKLTEFSDFDSQEFCNAIYTDPDWRNSFEAYDSFIPDPRGSFGKGYLAGVA